MRKQKRPVRESDGAFLRCGAFSDAADAVEEALETVEGNPDHVFIPIAIDLDLDHGLYGVEIGLLGLG